MTVALADGQCNQCHTFNGQPYRLSAAIGLMESLKA